MEHIKKRILQRMKELKISQLKLSGRAKISQSTVNRVLNSPTKSRIDTLCKIAKALNVPLEYLVINNETKALLCKTVSNMTDSDLQETILHIEKERLWKTKVLKD